MQFFGKRISLDLPGLAMTSRLLTVQNAQLCLAKPNWLLLLLINVQLNVGQEAVAVRNPLRSQSELIALKKSLSASQPQLVNLLCTVELGAAIETITNRSQFSRGHWGILIQSISSSQTLYSYDAKKYFVPASNVKLLSTAAALHQLGAKFRIRTSVYGTSNGSLRVVGRGDPSLTDAQLRELAQQLSRQGIRQVPQLIAEDDYFNGAAINPNWEWEDLQADYGAPVNSLILNQNAVELKLLPQQLGQPLRVVWTDSTEATQWRIENKSITAQQTQPTSINVSRDSAEPLLQITGQLGIDSEPESVALAILDPAKHFLRHFRRALVNEGIKINADTRKYPQILKHIRVHPRSSAFAELAFVESPPLSQLLVETNQNSNNLYAEALLHTLGVKASDHKKSTLEMGLTVVKSTLTSLGVNPTGYVLTDGSGLSRQNSVSPEALVQTLKAMARLPEAGVYRASLSVAGISGTLQNRFRNSAAQGVVQAKTGTVSGVVALSGYLDAPHYEPLVFSIIVNQSSQFDAATLKQAVDEIVLLLTRLRRC